MDSRVSPESGGLIGGVLALCANKWLLTTVNPHVISEAAQSIDCEVAWIATVGLLFIIQRLLGAENFKIEKVGYFWDGLLIFFEVIKLPESSVSSSCIGMCM